MAEQNKKNSVSKFRRIAHHPEIVSSGEQEWGMGRARASKRDLKKQRQKTGRPKDSLQHLNL